MPTSSRTRPRRLAPELLAEAPPSEAASFDDLARVAENAFSPVPRARMIPIERLAPSGDNPRKSFERIDELADSIAASGILQPLLVRRDPARPGYYKLIAGERRLQAAHRVQGFEDPALRERVAALPCIIRDENEQEAFADSLAENVARNDLTRAEIMDAYRRLRDEYGWGVRAIARRTGRSVGDVSELLNLSDDPRLAPIVRDELIAPTTASEIRRLPADLRERALAGVQKGTISKMADVQRLRRAAEQGREAASAPAGLAARGGHSSRAGEPSDAEVFNNEHLRDTPQAKAHADLDERSILNTSSHDPSSAAVAQAPDEERHAAQERQLRDGTHALVQALGLILNAGIPAPDDVRADLEAAYRSLGNYLNVTV